EKEGLDGLISNRSTRNDRNQGVRRPGGGQRRDGQSGQRRAGGLGQDRQRARDGLRGRRRGRSQGSSRRRGRGRQPHRRSRERAGHPQPARRLEGGFVVRESRNSRYFQEPQKRRSLIPWPQLSEPPASDFPATATSQTARPWD